GAQGYAAELGDERVQRGVPPLGRHALAAVVHEWQQDGRLPDARRPRRGQPPDGGRRARDQAGGEQGDAEQHAQQRPHASPSGGASPNGSGWSSKRSRSRSVQPKWWASSWMTVLRISVRNRRGSGKSSSIGRL